LLRLRARLIPLFRRRKPRSFSIRPEREAAIREVVSDKKRSHSRGDGALLVIAVFKFVKGAVLLAPALGDKRVKTSQRQVDDPNGGYVFMNYDAPSKKLYRKNILVKTMK